VPHGGRKEAREIRVREVRPELAGIAVLDGVVEHLVVGAGCGSMRMPRDEGGREVGCELVVVDEQHPPCQERGGQCGRNSQQLVGIAAPRVGLEVQVQPCSSRQRRSAASALRHGQHPA